jgi:hypothetical protein
MSRLDLFLILLAAPSVLPAAAWAQDSSKGNCGRASREELLPQDCHTAPKPLSVPDSAAAKPVTINLRIPAGTPLRVVLDERVRISTPGQPVHGKIIETVYAFDQPVILAGSAITGHVAKIEPVKKWRRIQAYANANFTPARDYQIEFDSVAFRSGERRKLSTTVSPGTPEVVHLIASAEKKKRNIALRKASEAKLEAEAKVHESVAEIKAPGKIHRLKQLVLAQSPYRRQYLEPGTRFSAVLDEPLDFGIASRTEEQLSQIGQPPPPDCLLHGRLLQEISSATATRGASVTAILTEPVFSSDHHLLLPAESRIEGEVLQAKPAGKLHHNGSLRVMFNRVSTPQGLAQSILGSLEGAEADRTARLKIDDEGGVYASDSKTRYLSTGLTLLMAAAASRPDVEHNTTDAAGDPGVRAGAGLSGFGISGSLITLAARSEPVSIGFAAYGASYSLYRNFLSRGRDVVFAKNTPMEIGFGAPRK